MASYADSLLNTTYINSTKLAVIGNDLNVGGKLDVSGNTTLKTTSVTGPLTTPAGFSVDTSSNVLTKGTLTLGNNSVVRSDGSGNFVVNGNVLATGSLVSNYNSTYPPIDPAADWEGVWTSAFANYIGYIAFVKQPNNTYTLYTNDIRPVNFNYGSFFRTRFQLVAKNIVPVFTKDASQNVTANSITIPSTLGSGSTVLLSRRLKTADIGSNFAFTPATALNGQNTVFYFYQRILVPTDVTPEGDDDWFPAYQSEYNEIRINNYTHMDVFDDIEGTYDSLKLRMLNSMGLNKVGIDVITGQKLPMNKLTPQPFLAENKFQKFKNDADYYSLPVSRIYFGVYAKQNIMTFHYDWKKQNEPSPIASPFQEMTIVDKANPFTPVIGTIPTSFKFLPSILEHQGCKQNTVGIKEPKEWFADNFVGLRLPLVVSGAKTLTITTTGPTGNFDVIPGVYTVTIPSGWTGYPHSLATYVTQNLDLNSGLRLDFYTKNKDQSNPEAFAASSYINFFYLSSGTNNIPSVSVTCTDTTFLTNVLGLNTLSTAQNPNAAPIQLPVPVSGLDNFSNLQRGGFPRYTYNGNQLDINNLYTPQSLPTSAANLTINFSIGNVITSNNPRDYYNAMFYFMNLCNTEEHAQLKNVMVLADIDQEYYMPDTYDEAIYKFVDLNAFGIYTSGVKELSTLNNCSPGVFGKAMANHSWNYNIRGPSQPFAGSSNIKHVNVNCLSAITLEKYYKPSLLNGILNNQGAYVATNYLDASNTFVLAYRFQSTVTNLLTKNMGSYWMPLYRSGVSNLPADVTVTGPTAVLFSVFSQDSSNNMYGNGTYCGSFFGLFKQSVANSILPADASGSVCGYSYFGSFSWNDTATNTNNYRDAFVNLCKTKGVKYVVTDVRGNAGGGSNASLTPFGLDKDYIWTSNLQAQLGSHWTAPNQSNYICRYNTVIADVLDNSGNWPSAWRYPVDSSGITITTLGGIDNTMYKRTGNPQYISVKQTRTSVGTNTVDGSNNGQGLFSFCYLTDDNSYSATKSQMNIFHNYNDTNNIPNTFSVGPLAPSPNTVYTVYGVYNRIFYSSINFTNNWDLNDTIQPGNGGSLDQNVFFDNGFDNLFALSFDLSNNYTGNSFNNPRIAYDATSNFSPLTMMTETGVYYDASGIQQGYTDGSRNAFSVSNDNVNSYRDFRVERALQCAYAQRAGCRAQSKFGYMPIDVGTSVKIVDTSGVKQVYDPYNWNITDTTGALPLPVNPFGL
jgi:hypothetical protein